MVLDCWWRSARCASMVANRPAESTFLGVLAVPNALILCPRGRHVGPERQVRRRAKSDRGHVVRAQRAGRKTMLALCRLQGNLETRKVAAKRLVELSDGGDNLDSAKTARGRWSGAAGWRSGMRCMHAFVATDVCLTLTWTQRPSTGRKLRGLC
jgi:hypothetical protein